MISIFIGTGVIILMVCILLYLWGTGLHAVTPGSAGMEDLSKGLPVKPEELGLEGKMPEKNVSPVELVVHDTSGKRLPAGPELLGQTGLSPILRKSGGKLSKKEADPLDSFTRQMLGRSAIVLPQNVFLTGGKQSGPGYAVRHLEEKKKEYPVRRGYHIAYPRNIGIGTAFSVDVTVGRDATAIRPASVGKEKAVAGILDFQAQEPEPTVQVELKFTEGDFCSNKTVDKKKISADRDTRFRFLLKALKAEDCILTAVISHPYTVATPEHITQKVTIRKTISSGKGDQPSETTEELTLAPASTDIALQTLESVDLKITVKSMFGLNANELQTLAKGLGVVSGVALILLGALSGDVQGTAVLPLFIVSSASALGIPIADAAIKTIQASKPTKADG